MLINKLFKYIKRQFSSEIQRLGDFYGLTNSDVKFNKNSFYLLLFDLEIPINKSYYFIIEGYSYLKKIHESYNTKLFFKSERLLLSIDNVVQEIQTIEDIFILSEIYTQGTYNFYSAHKIIVIDIGLNVGFASLYFTSSKNVKQIFSFEPFKQTFDQALNNINLNKHLKGKIQAFNFGLGTQEELKELSYNYQWKGSSGSTQTLNKLTDNKSISSELVLLKPISEIFKIINLQDATSKIGLKIDCEGAEYEFFDDLINSTDFSRVEFIMLEWHLKGPDFFINKLLLNNFICFSLLPRGINTGFIYASRIEKNV